MAQWKASMCRVVPETPLTGLSELLAIQDSVLQYAASLHRGSLLHCAGVIAFNCIRHPWFQITDSKPEYELQLSCSVPQG